jgi:hypothetical protein
VPQGEHRARGATPLVHELLQPRLAGGDDGDLGAREEAVDEDEDEDDEELGQVATPPWVVSAAGIATT